MLVWGRSGITGDEMGYSLLCFYIFAPTFSLLCGFFAGRKRGWGKWLYPLTGLLNWLTGAMVFGGGYSIASIIMIAAIAAFPALIGVASGTLSAKRRSAKDIEKMAAKDLHL